MPVFIIPLFWRSCNEFHNLFVIHFSAEQIQRAADGHMEPPPAKLLQFCKILKASHTARIGNRNPSPVSQKARQRFLDPPRLSFHIHRVDQKLRTAADSATSVNFCQRSVTI